MAVRRKYSRGATPATKLRRRTVPRIFNHPNPEVSIIIPAMNEEASLPKVLQQASKVHPQSETIVVVNGSTDRTLQIANQYGARSIHVAEALGHDVGRRIGAQAAKGKVLLFIDADIIINAHMLRPFVAAVQSGVDVALNGYSGARHKRTVHPVVTAKHVLNSILMRSDLEGASMTAIPHALSRRAIDRIGMDALVVPPLAHAMAIAKGLKVQTVLSVPVGKMNPVRYRTNNRAIDGGRGGSEDPLASLVVGDHLEALHWLISQYGSRAGYSDLNRQRLKLR